MGLKAKMPMDIRDLKEYRSLKFDNVYMRTVIDINKFSRLERDLARPTAMRREFLALLYGVNLEEHLPTMDGLS